MMTFDTILPKMAEIFRQHQADFPCVRPLLVNRDMNGRVRLIMDEKWEHDDRAMAAIDKITRKIEGVLGPHAYPAKDALLFESNFEEVLASEAKFSLEGIEGAYVVDRLATEGNWSSISPPNTTTPRIVFFSIKGGVGRSTALAATAWALAESGKRVLVLDLDLESPGLSSSLLPEDRRPTHGIAVRGWGWAEQT